MRLERFTFGSIRIDGVTYDQDVVIDRGKVRERRKKPSKGFGQVFGHTPLSVEEKIPWKCRRLVVGTGAPGALPVMDEVRREAAQRKVELLTLSTPKAIEAAEGPQRHQRDPARDLLTGRPRQTGGFGAAGRGERRPDDHRANAPQPESVRGRSRRRRGRRRCWRGAD